MCRDLSESPSSVFTHVVVRVHGFQHEIQLYDSIDDVYISPLHFIMIHVHSMLASLTSIRSTGLAS